MARKYKYSNHRLRILDAHYNSMDHTTVNQFHIVLLFFVSVVFLSVVLSGFFTVLYSMQWGHTKSVDWLTTFLLSMVQSIVFVQPVKVRLFTAFCAVVEQSVILNNIKLGQVFLDVKKIFVGFFVFFVCFLHYFWCTLVRFT